MFESINERIKQVLEDKETTQKNEQFFLKHSREIEDNLKDLWHECNLSAREKTE